MQNVFIYLALFPAVLLFIAAAIYVIACLVMRTKRNYEKTLREIEKENSKYE